MMSVILSRKEKGDGTVYFFKSYLAFTLKYGSLFSDLMKRSIESCSDTIMVKIRKIRNLVKNVIIGYFNLLRAIILVGLFSASVVSFQIIIALLPFSSQSVSMKEQDASRVLR